MEEKGGLGRRGSEAGKRKRQETSHCLWWPGLLHASSGLMTETSASDETKVSTGSAANQ